jgi:hypothetical protein
MSPALQTPRGLMLVAASIPALSACGQNLLTPEELPAELRATDVSVTSWEQIVREDFSFRLPPGFVKTEAIPIDSDAASYVRGEDFVSHDYGAYSGPWTRTPNKTVSDVIERWVELGGRRAQLVSFRLDGRYVIRAWWGGVGRSLLSELDLVVRGETSSAGVRQELLGVIHSVRFH